MEEEEEEGEEKKGERQTEGKMRLDAEGAILRQGCTEEEEEEEMKGERGTLDAKGEETRGRLEGRR
ncbi:hypothetical protein E2C01_097850 [Portunus trituberculatus]|uniref:Uncharacterized protein n=1 Tax=Portunus trituberculatus TaxID=210409 RepID=A0A5B7K5X1_PORTR|nr:hypothetical protein [Portunus trituberculatus]